MTQRLDIATLRSLMDALHVHYPRFVVTPPLVAAWHVLFERFALDEVLGAFRRFLGSPPVRCPGPQDFIYEIEDWRHVTRRKQLGEEVRYTRGERNPLTVLEGGKIKKAA